MGVKYLSDTNSSGVTLGNSTTDLISFYGVTPIVQRSGGTQAKVSTTAITPVATTVITPVNTTAPTSTTESITAINALIAAVNSVITQSAANMTAINLTVTQSAANMVLANELRASLVALGAIAGA
jgi:hypothetical protein